MPADHGQLIAATSASERRGSRVPPAAATAAEPGRPLHDTPGGLRRRDRRVALVVGAGVVAGLTLAGCGGGGGSAGGGSTPTHSAAAAAKTSTRLTVATHTGSLGTYLTDAAGRALYEFAADHRDHSVCYGSCATYWPPLTATAAPRVSGTARSSLVGLTTRQGGKRQVTYAGHPLYYYSGDHGPGTTTGQGLNVSGGLWWLVSPAGTSITAHPGGATSPSPTGGGYGGYGGGGY